MANPNTILVDALRKTALQLKNGATYAWGNHGACNCGHLLQVVTTLNQEDIVGLAQTGIGEWTEAQFTRAVREGKDADGGTLDELMPSQTFKAMTDDEVHALWLYVKSVPPKPFGHK